MVVTSEAFGKEDDRTLIFTIHTCIHTYIQKKEEKEAGRELSQREEKTEMLSFLLQENKSSSEG